MRRIRTTSRVHVPEPPFGDVAVKVTVPGATVCTAPVKLSMVAIAGLLLDQRTPVAGTSLPCELRVNAVNGKRTFNPRIMLSMPRGVGNVSVGAITDTFTAAVI